MTVQPISTPTGLLGNVNSNGVGPSGHMDGPDILEVIIDSLPSM